MNPYFVAGAQGESLPTMTPERREALEALVRRVRNAEKKSERARSEGAAVDRETHAGN